MNLFEFDDYKRLIEAKIKENAAHRAYRSLLAQKIGCQKSYFSQVMNSHIHLTPDHGALLAQFWGFSEGETAYFVDLILYARASSEALKRHVRARLNQARSSRESPSEQFAWPALKDEAAKSLYYSSWHWSAIHILVSVPGFKTASSVAEKLGLPLATVESALKWLEKVELVRRRREGGWNVTDQFLFLPNHSPMNEAHHLSWRARAMANLQSQDKESLHYSSVFTLSAEDFHKVKAMIVAYVDSLHKIISPSEPEELVCLGCDLFKVGHQLN
jgi:uncharacterized protein (TIGR02147 family)